MRRRCRHLPPRMSAFLLLSLHLGERTRRSLVRGAGAQDVSLFTLSQSRWLMHPTFLLVSPSRDGRRSSLSIWSRPCLSATDSVELGEAQTIAQVWEEYFADPSQWWDNRACKMNPSSPDFKHKVTEKALSIDDSPSPPWVKAMLKLMIQSKLPPHVGFRTTDSQEFIQPNRLPKGNFGRRNILRSSARESKQPVQVGGGGMHSQTDNTASEAIFVLKKRLQQGIAVDSYSFLEILKLCLRQEDLTAARQIHECFIERGMQQSVYLSNNLLSAYIKCGALEDACRLFKGLAKKDVVSWNVMIGGYAQHRRPNDVTEIFYKMRREGVQPNAATYLSILKAFASPSALKSGEEFHDYIRHDGYGSDVRVGTALIKMYAQCESIKQARETFDKLASRNVISWNVMIAAYADRGFGEEAYQLLLQMKQEGFTANLITYTSILKACASAGALELVKEIHGQVLEAGLVPDLRLGSALVHIYAKCGSMDAARQLFDRMDERDVVTWNVIIGAYAERGRGEEAYQLFLQMIQEGFKPDAITYNNILNACASAGALEWVKVVHNHAREGGLEANVYVGNALIHMYAKCGSIDDSRLVFERMEQRNVITWNVIIGAYAESDSGEEAYGLFHQMIREGLNPDAVTYVSILNACAGGGALEWVKEVHSHACKAELDLNVSVGNALVHMYAKCGSINDARQLFDRMEERDVITWNVMIGGLAHHGCGSEALEVFRNMREADVKPDGYSFVAVLSACSHAGLVAEGRQLFLAMSQDEGIVPSVLHWNCMVDLLGRAGLLEDAKLLIDQMPVAPDAATWGALLSACRSYGDEELGELAAEERLKLAPKDATTYVLLSNIHAAAEKWEKVSLVRTMMEKRGIRKETGRSWIKVNGKIHTFVGGGSSHANSKEIYAELSRLTEKITAEGYLPDTRLVLHDIDERDKEFSLCSHSEKLAIAYGLINTTGSTTGSEPIRVYKNLRVCLDCHSATKFISKVTRKEIVVRDANRFHHFKDGVCSCKDYW